MNKRLLITIGIVIFISLGTILAIRFAKGYRLNVKDRKVTETGLLVANSFPTGASVYINDKLTTATNDTINLPPKEYKVKIVKDGYIAWEKLLKIEKELVTQTNTRLFPAVPNLSSLTNSGAQNIVPSPDGEKLAYVVASASAAPKNGLYVMDLADRTLSFSSGSRQLAKNIPSFNFTKAKLTWAPNSKQILARDENNNFLLDIDKTNDLSTQPDVTARISIILDEWEEELDLQKKERMLKLPDVVQKIATDSAKNVYFSPDEEKLMYTATASASIPENLIPPLPASNSQPESRNIEPGNVYVYDLKEDKNFFITQVSENQVDKLTKDTKSNLTRQEILQKRLNNIQNQFTPLNVQNVQWFPSSSHLIIVESDKIAVCEYDGTNKVTVYAGPFEKYFAYPWPDGSRLITLTTLNPDSTLPPNLYAIDLK